MHVESLFSHSPYRLIVIPHAQYEYSKYARRHIRTAHTPVGPCRLFASGMEATSSMLTRPTNAVGSGVPVASALAERAGAAYRAVSARAEDAWAAATQLQLNWADMPASRRAALVGFTAAVAAAAAAAVAIADRSHDKPVYFTAASVRSVKPAPLPPPRERHIRNDVPGYLERRRKFKEREAAQRTYAGDRCTANTGTAVSERSVKPAPLPPPRERHIRNDVPGYLERRRKFKEREAAQRTCASDRCTANTGTTTDSTTATYCHATGSGTTVNDKPNADALATDLGTQEPSGVLACDEACGPLRTRQNHAIAEALDALPDHAVDKGALAVAVNAAINADTDGNLTETLEQLEATLGSLASGLPPKTT
eukprot:COSAG02_NODE_441_length_22281_cov_6.119556_9_plen_367_part_00